MLQGITNNASPSVLPTTQKSAQDLKNQFLKMLLTQLKNQDPTQPVDSTQMIAQQAQFASLEQSQNLNVQLATLLAQQNVTQATNLIGKTITGRDTSGIAASGKVTGVEFKDGTSLLTVDLGSGNTTQMTLANISSVGL